MKDAMIEVKDKQVAVKVFDNIAEAQKAMGDQNLLDLINGAVISKERAKHHREGQLETAAERRKLHKLLIDAALKLGVDPKTGALPAATKAPAGK